MKVSRTRRISTWLLALAMLGVLFITALPELMRLSAIALLERQDNIQVSINDIDFNPFTGEFEIKQLTTASGLTLKRAKVRLDWWPLWHHKLAITELRGDSLTLHVTLHADGGLDIGGIAIPAATNSKAAGPDHSSAATWQITLPAADFTHLDLALNLPANGATPARQIRIGLNDLYLNRLSFGSNGILADELRMDGFTASDSAGQIPKSLLRLQLHGLKFDIESRLQLADAKILKLELAPPAPFTGGSVKLIALKKLQVAPKGPLSLASLLIEQAVLPHHQSTQMGSFSTLELHDLRSKSFEKAHIGKLALKQLQLPAGKAARLGRIGTIDIAALDASPRNINMDALAIRDMRLALLRRKGGGMALPEMPGENAAPKKESSTTRKPATSEPAEAKPLQLRIGALSINGDSRIDLRDESVHPAFKSDIAIRHFSMTPLVLGAAEAGKLDLDLTLNQQSRLQAKGSLTPDPGHLTTNLSVSLKELSLPELSPYIEQALHIAIKTGQLDIDSKAKLANDKLASDNSIHIRRLQIESGKDSPVVGGMTINTALEMIREDNGDINLDVPLNGPLDNIQAGLGDVINKALITAMQKAALAYASQYLYPYGTIISVAETVAKAAMAQPRLTPITFPPLQAKLDEKGLDYAGKIAGLLKDKKQIRLQVCGVSAPAEILAAGTKQPALNEEQLFDLAKARSRQVVETIAGHGIATDRLFACKPEIDHTEKATGRVELLLE